MILICYLASWMSYCWFDYNCLDIIYWVLFDKLGAKHDVWILCLIDKSILGFWWIGMLARICLKHVCFVYVAYWIRPEDDMLLLGIKALGKNGNTPILNRMSA